MSNIRAVVGKFEASDLGKQVFRFVRLAVVGVVAAKLTNSALDTTGAVAIVETCFRQVFP